MHVVHLETGRRLYGGARQVLYLLDGLARHQVEVTLVCPPDSAIRSAAGSEGVEVFPLPMAGDLDFGFTSRFVRYLKRARPDIVHVHSRRGADHWGGLAARRAGVPAVLSRRVDSPSPPIFGRFKYRFYERVIAISEDIGKQLVRERIETAKLAVVHSAIDAKALEPAWTDEQFREAFGLEPGEPAIAVVGQLIPRKGHRYILSVWRDILGHHPGARLLLFGTGPEEPALREQARSLGVEDSVVFAGFRGDLREFMAHIDVLVHPATREGLGVCLLEAQAAGVPIVACRAGGVPETFEDRVSGLLVPPEEPAALANAVIALLRSPQQRAEMGAAGREHVCRNFSVDSMVAGNLEVYEQILGGRGR